MVKIFPAMVLPCSERLIKMFRIENFDIRRISTDAFDFAFRADYGNCCRQFASYWAHFLWIFLFPYLQLSGLTFATLFDEIFSASFVPETGHPGIVLLKAAQLIYDFLQE